MKLAAVIAESRDIDSLHLIVHLHRRELPINTDLFTFGFKDRIRKDAFKRMDSNMVVVNEKCDIKGIEDYNRLLTSPIFWQRFLDLGYDRVLIFQADSMLLRTGIQEFYEYDYVGASWTWNTDHIGNGGLSLRNPKIMKEICEKFTWDGSRNEDHWICEKMFTHKIGNLAPIEVADKFSCEAKFIKGTLGYHAISKYLTPEQCSEIETQYDD